MSKFLKSIGKLIDRFLRAVLAVEEINHIFKGGI